MMKDLFVLIIWIMLIIGAVKMCESIDSAKSIGAAVGQNIKDFREATK